MQKILKSIEYCSGDDTWSSTSSSIVQDPLFSCYIMLHDLFSLNGFSDGATPTNSASSFVWSKQYCVSSAAVLLTGILSIAASCLSCSTCLRSAANCCAILSIWSETNLLFASNAWPGVLFPKSTFDADYVEDLPGRRAIGRPMPPALSHSLSLLLYLALALGISRTGFRGREKSLLYLSFYFPLSLSVSLARARAQFFPGIKKVALLSFCLSLSISLSLLSRSLAREWIRTRELERSRARELIWFDLILNRFSRFEDVIEVFVV